MKTLNTDTNIGIMGSHMNSRRFGASVKKSGNWILVVTLVIISLSSSGVLTSSSTSVWEWETDDSVVIEATNDNSVDSTQGERHKRQFQFPGVPGFPFQFPPGWPFSPQGGGLPGFPTTPASPTVPSQIGSCLTRHGKPGRCTTFRQCYPVVYSSVDGETEEIGNEVLAAQLRDASGPCDVHTMPNFLIFRADALLRQNQNFICCGGSGGGGSNKRPTQTPRPPDTSHIFHPQITMRPPWAQWSTQAPTTRATSTTPVPTQWTPRITTAVTTTTQPSNNLWPNWPPAFITHPPMQNTPTAATHPPFPTHRPFPTQGPPSTQSTYFPPNRPPSAATTPAPVVQPPVASSCGYAKIVGGSQATKGEFPWLVALMMNGRQVCGGSLIDSYWILTAAHCVSHCVSHYTGDMVKAMRIHIGDYDLYSHTDGAATIKGVSKLIYNKRFNHQTLHNDIALLKLDSPVQFGTNGNNNIQPICLAQGGGYEGSTVTVAGWGGLYENGPQPSKYHKVQLTVWSNQQCAAKYGGYAPGGITSQMVCAASTGKDACRGDSGGPLMRNTGGRWEQIGLVSWGIGCGQYPGVYSRIDQFQTWIANNRVY